jgi:hypothetical protein
MGNLKNIVKYVDYSLCLSGFSAHVKHHFQDSRVLSGLAVDLLVIIGASNNLVPFVADC